MGFLSRLFGSKSQVVDSAWVWDAKEDWVPDIKGIWRKMWKIGRRTWVEMQVIEYRGAGAKPTWLVPVGGVFGEYKSTEVLRDVDHAKSAVEYAVTYIGRRARWL